METDTMIITNKAMIETTNPAGASPFGLLPKPTLEKMMPKSQKIQPRTGITPKKSDNMAKTKPAVPILFLRSSLCT